MPAWVGQGPLGYWWGDGIYSGLRAEGQRLCALVVVGVNDRGEKRFLAIEEGVRESKQSWREVLFELKARGLSGAAELSVGDGARGFLAALEEIFPATRGRRCWVHRTANLLNTRTSREPPSLDRLTDLMHHLTADAFLAELLTPGEKVLGRVLHAALGRSLSIGDFITAQVLRHIQGMPIPGEHV